MKNERELRETLLFATSVNEIVKPPERAISPELEMNRITGESKWNSSLGMDPFEGLNSSAPLSAG